MNHFSLCTPIKKQFLILFLAIIPSLVLAKNNQKVSHADYCQSIGQEINLIVFSKHLYISGSFIKIDKQQNTRQIASVKSDNYSSKSIESWWQIDNLSKSIEKIQFNLQHYKFVLNGNKEWITVVDNQGHHKVTFPLTCSKWII